MRLARARRRRRGMALIPALLLVLASSGMALLLMTVASTSNRNAEVRRARVTARYLAEGGVEAVRAEIQSTLQVGRTPDLEGSVGVDGAEVAYTLTELPGTGPRTTAEGLRSYVTEYEVEARADVPGAHARAWRVVRAEVTPIFQFALFFEGDLEIWPGPPMVMGGPVRTNGDLFMGTNSSLTFDTNYIHVAGRVHQHRKHSDQVNDGEVLIRRWVDDPLDPGEPEVLVPLPNKDALALEGVESTSGMDSSFGGHDRLQNADFGGLEDLRPFPVTVMELFSEPDFYTGGSGYTLKTAEHEVQAAAVPAVDEIAMFVEVEGALGGDHVFDASRGQFLPSAAGQGTHVKGAFHAAADLTILTRDDGTWRAFDGRGDDVTVLLRDVVTVGELHDARQGGEVEVTTIDVSVLNASGLFPENGLLYAASYGAGTGTEAKGVRLIEGAELLRPLTLVSENSVYVQGDFNTEAKKSAAVICDAVNLLSNAWSDDKAGGQLPEAHDTTYNVSFISGNTPSSDGVYSGGVENLPRFHENWSGKSCNLSGSMVVLWESRYATGAWRYGGDRYTAPIRNWSYDADLADLSRMPPYTPAFSVVEDVVSW